MYNVLIKLSEYKYFYVSEKKNASYSFLLVFKIIKSFPCKLKERKRVNAVKRSFVF